MKRRSVSSALAELRRQRRNATPTKSTVRLVKFSPEEMAYDPSPEETAKWTPVGRGMKGLFAKPKARLVPLEPDVAKVFKDAAAVNNALRKIIEAMPHALPRKRK